MVSTGMVSTAGVDSLVVSRVSKTEEFPSTANQPLEGTGLCPRGLPDPVASASSPEPDRLAFLSGESLFDELSPESCFRLALAFALAC